MSVEKGPFKNEGIIFQPIIFHVRELVSFVGEYLEDHPRTCKWLIAKGLVSL